MISYEWECPGCGAYANKHGKGECSRTEHDCMGFICECERETSESHGETLADPCTNATCYHCGWAGSFPAKPKGMQAWEKKALEAGWTMPDSRAKELGIK